MYIPSIETNPHGWGDRQPIATDRNLFFLLYNRYLDFFSAMLAERTALAAQGRKAIFTLSVQNSQQKHLDSAARVVFRGPRSLIQLSGHLVGNYANLRWPSDEIKSTRIAFAVFVRKVLTAMAPSKPVRTTISLTDAEVDALKNLREHFDTQSVSETIRRSIAQSSLLKRYSDEEGDLLVERDGKKFVIPSRR